MTARPGPRTSTSKAAPHPTEVIEKPTWGDVLPSTPVRVMLETPWAGREGFRETYAERAMLDSLRRNEAPFPTHLLYPRVLDDKSTGERARGFRCHRAWTEKAQRIVCYTDYGISPGMTEALKLAGELNIPVEIRTIGTNERPHKS